MIKKGFTLQELLITLAIIGVVAAIVGPGIVGLMPSKSKAMYLKAYNILTNQTNEILGDTSLYWTTYDNDSGEPTCSGMYCDDKPEVEPYDENKFSGREKFPRIFASKLNLAEEPENVDGGIQFRTADGIQWLFKVEDEADGDLPGDHGYVTELTIDVNPDNENDAYKCTYDENDCSSPEQFVFEIDNDGGITPVDPLGQAFLRNPTEMNSMSKDKEAANNLAKEKK